MELRSDNSGFPSNLHSIWTIIRRISYILYSLFINFSEQNKCEDLLCTYKRSEYIAFKNGPIYVKVGSSLFD